MMLRLIQVIMFIFIASLPGEAYASNQVIGAINGVIRISDQYFIEGWACQTGRADRISIHIRYNGVGGLRKNSGETALLAEPSISNQCVATGTGNFRFRIPIPQADRDTYGGQRIFIHGIALRHSGATNRLLDNSGVYHVPGAGNTPSEKLDVTGELEGVVIGKNQSGDDAYFLSGWTCQEDDPDPLSIRVWADQSAYNAANKGVRVFGANHDTAGRYRSEVSINAICKTDTANNPKHRFLVEIPESALEDYQGRNIIVHGIRNKSDVRNSELVNSGRFVFPAPLADQPRGCMASTVTRAGPRNAYPTAFRQAQGSPWIYMAWVWRERPDAAANHSVSVIRTKDMINWENTCGEPVSLPISPDSKTVVDQVAFNQGLLNNIKFGFDETGNPVITYQKYKLALSEENAPNLTTQIYNARFDGEKWTVHEMTNWMTAHLVSGGGTMDRGSSGVRFGPVVSGRSNSNPSEIITTQYFRRADDDTSGFPTNDRTWRLSSDASEIMGAISAPGRDSLIEVDDNFSKEPATPAPGYNVSQFDDFDDNGVQYSSVSVTPYVQKDAVALRGSWHCTDGFDRYGGLFLRKMRTFFLKNPVRANGQANRIDKVAFGPGKKELYPLIGDWDNSGDCRSGPTHGGDTIGVYDPVSNRYWLKDDNINLTGLADKTGFYSKGALQLADSPLMWSDEDPTNKYRVVHQTLPANGDVPYNCDGETVGHDDLDWEDCPERWETRIELLSYDYTTSQWNREIVDDNAWGGSAAGLGFMFFKRYLIVAYYDQNRNVKVARRHLSDTEWSFWSSGQDNEAPAAAPFNGWDKHNYLTLEIDENHHAHLTGNMHSDELKYWRSVNLLSRDPIEFKRDFPMVPSNADKELKATYPSFFRGPNGQFLYMYRDGGSGDGDWLIYEYDLFQHEWSLFNEGLLFNRL